MRVWRLDEAGFRLRSLDDSVPLTPKAASVLRVLVENVGEVVTRETILEEVWGGLSVTPDLVREYVHDLRTALGCDPKNPTHIETVRGKGFRLLGGVTLEGDDTAWGDRPVIAILRPDVFVDEAVWRPIADALGEEITVDLAPFPELQVIARHSSYAVDLSEGLAAAARRLGANYCLSTSLMRSGAKVKLAFQFAAMPGDRVIWSDAREVKAEDLVSLTSDLSVALANALGNDSGQLIEAERSRIRHKSNGFSAYEAYLLALDARQTVSLESFRRGLAHIDDSLSRDSGSARAWVMRCWFLRSLVHLFGDPELDPATTFEEANAALERAVALDPNDPLVLAWSVPFEMLRGARTRAEDRLSRALDLGHNQADILIMCGYHMALSFDRAPTGLPVVDRALRLSPDPPDWYRTVAARVAFFACDFERAQAELDLVETSQIALLYKAVTAMAMEQEGAAREAVASLAEYFPDYDAAAYLDNAGVIGPLARAQFTRLALRCGLPVRPGHSSSGQAL
ncbi:MAG: winged helix-turn-helix domain-containing protein, partial [Pseudomonadota bacterium]